MCSRRTYQQIITHMQHWCTAIITNSNRRTYCPRTTKTFINLYIKSMWQWMWGTFKNDRCDIIHEDQVILTGPRDPTTTLWKIPINMDADASKQQHEPIAQVNLAHEQCSSSVSVLMQFLHLVSFSPKPSTWIKGIKINQYILYPNLTAHNVKKYLPKSTTTAKCHLDKHRINEVGHTNVRRKLFF